MRRKGELSPAAVDRGWPHQIALPGRFCEGGGYNEIHDFCKDLTLCTRGHAVYDREWFHVYCFSKPEDDHRTKNEHLATILLPNPVAADDTERHAPDHPLKICRQINTRWGGGSRAAVAITAFRVRCIQPLCHLSG